MLAIGFSPHVHRCASPTPTHAQKLKRTFLVWGERMVCVFGMCFQEITWKLQILKWKNVQTAHYDILYNVTVDL